MWRTWRQPAWLGWAQLALAAGALSLLPGAEAAGRLLLAPAAVALALSGLRDLLLSPTLAAGPEGLRVVDGTHRRTASWGEVERVRVVRDRRVPLLEIDLGSTVVVLSRRRLGADVEQVREELLALRV